MPNKSSNFSSWTTAKDEDEDRLDGGLEILSALGIYQVFMDIIMLDYGGSAAASTT